MTSPHKGASSQLAINMQLHSRQSTATLASDSGKTECVWKGLLGGVERGTGPSETSPDPGTISERHARLTFSHPSPPCFFLGFLLSSPLCPRVISLMMCNALKVFYQPDLLKWSMGNAMAYFSSHPRSLSLSLCRCLFLSRLSPAIISAAHRLS